LKKPEIWEIENAREQALFSTLERVNYTESWSRNQMFREPMDLHPEGNWITVWKRYPNLHKDRRYPGTTINYGWRWICRHPDHKHPVHGGSAYGFQATIIAATCHFWKKHRNA
jgi:hypothetical protein